MGFDKLIVSLSKDDNKSETFELKKLIAKKITHCEKSKELFVILPPWHSKIKYNYFVRRYLKNKGYYCIEYEFPAGILSSNYKNTVKYFEKIKKSVVKDIIRLQKEHKFEHINIVGVSLGCVNASMIADSLKDLSSLVLVVPGHCLAESMWKGIKTKWLRREFKNKGLKLNELKEYWKELAPKNNFKTKNNKNVSIYLSKEDKIIPYECGLKLVHSVEKKQKVNYYENRFLGHYITSMKFLLFPRKFLSK
ncbi:MAG: hypothetical protein PF542_02440 [Nanoarchaeota archaeon]|jgi:esterase/lipase|nr:hypothetical protein [Nanoarchaeota archaeon]